MVDTEMLRTIVGIMGNIVSFCLFASPIPTFIKIVKNKSVMNFKPDPYIATVLNCGMWLFYGMPFITPNNLLVITINSVGLSMELIYVAIFILYTDKRKKMIIVLLVEVVFMVLIVFLTLRFFHTMDQRSFIVGLVCIFFNILMYASPLTVMSKVIKTKSVKYMPFALSLANLCNGIIWLLYSLLKFDIFIMIPNILGMMSGVVQLVLYVLYYKTTNWDDDEEDEKPKPPKQQEVQLADAV